MPSAPSTRSSESPDEPSPRAGRSPWSRWLPVVVWAAFISWFSSDAFSARSTHNYIDPILRLLLGDLTPEGFRFWHAVVRKTAHFVEYFVLAVLLVRALAAPRLRIAAATVLRAVALCALYASLDELHQYFVPSRGAAVLDVALDTFGATMGVLAFTIGRNLRAREPSGDARGRS